MSTGGRLSPRRSVPLGGDRHWQRPLGATLSPLRRRLRWCLFVLAGFFVGVGVFDRIVMPRVTRHGDEVVIPDCVGVPLDEARGKLAAADLQAADGPTHFSADIPRGQVIGSSPLGGMRVKRGREVFLSVSLGVVDHRVPDVMGLSLRMARVQLQELGLNMGDVAYAAVGETDAEEILAMSPEPGAPLPSEGTVSFLLSKKRKATAYHLPDLRGYSISEVMAWLRANGFSAQLDQSGLASDTPVLATDPPAGGLLWAGSVVRLATTSLDAFSAPAAGRDRISDETEPPAEPPPSEEPAADEGDQRR